MRSIVVVLIASIALMSCAHKVSKFYPEIIPKRMNTTISVGKNNKHSVNLTYLGCGSMIIEQDGDAIITDPFFSNQKLSKMWGKVATDPEQFELWKGRVQSQASKGMVRAGLVSHTHYDHVMDLPTLLQSHYFPNMQAVYGNSYLPQMMVNFVKDGVNVQSLKTDQWIEVTPKIRFMAIESSHAPQTGKKLRMNGPFDAEYFKENLTWSNEKLKTKKWTAGTTYSFLVDFIQGDTVRFFIQTSASQYPAGRPPKDELQKKKVDVAVLCYASTLNVTDYPKAIVNDINPSKLVIVHWEDFFREAKSDDDVKLVRKTNSRRARRRFDELGKKKDFFVMPKPGTKIQITK
jgi:L-ascorbate metabolism protein UlaG (beta-lactamase superfamily)